MVHRQTLLNSDDIELSPIEHTELLDLDQHLKRSRLNPSVIIAFLAESNEGLGIGVGIATLITALGLSVSLLPVIIAGLILAGAYGIHKIFDIRRKKQLEREAYAALMTEEITKQQYALWQKYIPGVITSDNKEIDIETYVKCSTPEEILIDAVEEYRRLTAQIDEIFMRERLTAHMEFNDALLLAKRKIAVARARLELHIKNIAHSIKDQELARQLNAKMGREIIVLPPPKIRPAPKGEGLDRFFSYGPVVNYWTRRSVSWLRKSFKSLLAGAGTGAGLATLICASIITTTSIALFPWSVVMLVGFAIAGAVLAYIVDKRGNKIHQRNMNAIAQAKRDLDNKRHFTNLLMHTRKARLEIADALSDVSVMRSQLVEEADERILRTGKALNELPKERLSFEETENNRITFREISAIQQPQAKRRNLATLFASLVGATNGIGMGAIIFAGLTICGVSVVFWPFIILGAGFALAFVAHHYSRRGEKEDIELEKMASLYHIIHPQKITCWRQELQLLGEHGLVNAVGEAVSVNEYVKNSTPENIYRNMVAKYHKLTFQIEAFRADAISKNKTNDSDVQHTIKQLDATLRLLKLQLQSHTSQVNNQDQASQMRGYLGVRLNLTQTPFKPRTLWERVKHKAKPVFSFIGKHYKDVFEGALLGTSIAVTAFAIVGLAAVTAFMPWSAIILAGAAVVGIAVKLTKTHFTKKRRNQHLNDIERAKHALEDKSHFMDMLITTKKAQAKVTQIIEKHHTLQQEKYDDLHNDLVHNSPLTSPLVQPAVHHHDDDLMPLVPAATPEANVIPLPTPTPANTPIRVGGRVSPKRLPQATIAQLAERLTRDIRGYGQLRSHIDSSRVAQNCRNEDMVDGLLSDPRAPSILSVN